MLMNNTQEVCAGKLQCKGTITNACNCKNPVMFLCRDCILDHLAEPTAHVFLTLDQARALSQNPSSSDSFCEGLLKFVRLTNEIQKYLRSIDQFKENINNLKFELIALIEQECATKLEMLNSIQLKSIEVLELIKQRTGSFINSEDELLVEYNSKGLHGLIDEYVESFSIDHHNIKKSIQSMIRLDTRGFTDKTPRVQVKDVSCSSDAKPIYFTKCKSKQLIRYDCHSNEIITHSLGQAIEKGFYRSSSCMLPSGDIMIVGTGAPPSGDTYRYDTSTGECFKLKSLNNSRGSVHLFYHDSYLYAFGGCLKGKSSRKSERMELEGEGWFDLSDMKEGRYYFGSHYIDGKLYLIGGYDNTTIEYYDFYSNIFTLLHGVSVPQGGNIVAAIDDKIFVICQKELNIFSHQFESLKTESELLDRNIMNMSSVMISDKDIIFPCLNNKAIFKLNTDKNKLTILKSFS